MRTNEIYIYLHKQIPVMAVLSLFPGLGYILLGWYNDMYLGAVLWYVGVVLVSIWGYTLYKDFDINNMGNTQLEEWYKKTSILFYLVLRVQ